MQNILILNDKYKLAQNTTFFFLNVQNIFILNDKKYYTYICIFIKRIIKNT